jgi:hypothetical protein
MKKKSNLRSKTVDAKLKRKPTRQSRTVSRPQRTVESVGSDPDSFRIMEDSSASAPSPAVSSSLPEGAIPSWWISLSNLVRLDWANKSRPFYLHGFGTLEARRLGYKAREYTVESLDPESTGTPFVRLLPERPYYLVPIHHEESTLPDMPHRQLLVRDQEQADERQARIFVVAPPTSEISERGHLRIIGDKAVAVEEESEGEEFAHLHIVGGMGQGLSTAGIVEAILTPILTLAAQQESVESLRPLPPPPPPEPTPSSTERLDLPVLPQLFKAETPSVNEALNQLDSTAVDHDLLNCIDALNLAKDYYKTAAKGFDDVREDFHHYLDRKFGLKLILVVVGQTLFDPKLGHEAVSLTHVPAFPNDAIAKVIRDGYTLGGKVVRPVQVIVNRAAALRRTTVTPSGHYFGVVIDQPKLATLNYLSGEALENLNAIDMIYSILAVLKFGDSSTIMEFVTLMKESRDSLKDQISLIHEFLDSAYIAPLRIASLRYGSPLQTVFEVVKEAKGLPKYILGLIDNHRRKPHTDAMDKKDEQKADLGLHSDRLALINQRIEIDHKIKTYAHQEANETLDLVERVIKQNANISPANLPDETKEFYSHILQEQLQRINYVTNPYESAQLQSPDHVTQIGSGK